MGTSQSDVVTNLAEGLVSASLSVQSPRVRVCGVSWKAQHKDLSSIRRPRRETDTGAGLSGRSFLPKTQVDSIGLSGRSF